MEFPNLRRCSTSSALRASNLTCAALAIPGVPGQTSVFFGYWKLAND
jgi:hypothetical protein